jgi:polar amino acid transport system substrate-binding protein
LAGLLLVAAGASAWGQSTLDRIRSQDVVRVGVAAERPYGYLDAGGKVTGEAPEIARAIFKRIDPEIRLEGVTMDFGDLIGAVQDGTIDVIAAGMFVTPERCGQIDFSEPTYVVGESFVVRAGNPKGLTDFAVISNHADARVALISGTVEYNYAYVAGIPADRALLYTSFDRAVEALKEGEVDAIGVTALTANSIASSDPGLEATPQFFPVLDGSEVKGYGAFGFRKGDDDLRDVFNEELEAYVGTPEHRSTVSRFGFGPDMAPDRTTAELCSG